MKNRRYLVAAALLLLLPLGCAPSPLEVAAQKLVLASLLDSQLEADLSAPVALVYPVHVGIMAVGYETALHPEDEDAQLAALASSLSASPTLVAKATVVPPQLTNDSNKTDDLRRTAAQLGVDTMVLISGTPEWDQATSIPVGFWDYLNHKTNYEARIGLTAATMEVGTGRYVAPYLAAGHAGPGLVVPDDNTSTSAGYALKKAAEVQALTALKPEILQSLTENMAAQAAARAKAATPAPTSTPATSTSPVPTVTPSVSPSASVTNAASGASAAATASGAAKS